MEDASQSGRRCPACRSERSAPWGAVRARGAGRRIFACSDCGCGFVAPRPDPGAVAAGYRGAGYRHEGGAGETAAGLLARERRFPLHTAECEAVFRRLDRLLARAPGRVHWLDVGCGAGFSVAAAERRGWRVTALEPSRRERRLARGIARTPPRAEPFETFEGGGPYDGILMSHVLEHAHDPDAWVAKAAGQLRPGGVLMVLTPNFRGLPVALWREAAYPVRPPEHLQFFTPRALRTLLTRHGLEPSGWGTHSRISPETAARRLPPGLRALRVPLARLANAGLAGLDRVRGGFAIWMAARKPAAERRAGPGGRA